MRLQSPSASARTTSLIESEVRGKPPDPPSDLRQSRSRPLSRSCMAGKGTGHPVSEVGDGNSATRCLAWAGRTPPRRIQRRQRTRWSDLHPDRQRQTKQPRSGALSVIGSRSASPITPSNASANSCPTIPAYLHRPTLYKCPHIHGNQSDAYDGSYSPAIDPSVIYLIFIIVQGNRGWYFELRQVILFPFR